ncbi:transmembrane protein 154 isoform X2 [Channa argus]|uniref:transmembrane protein 154 isoform X2 n=1 Tax=Channa argus TaxID=215402 RepID=UPI003521FF09
MSASQPGNMSGLRLMTPLLLLLLLLVTTLNGTGIVTSEDDAGDSEAHPAVSTSTLEPDASTTEQAVDENKEDHGSGLSSIPDVSETTVSPTVIEGTSEPLMDEGGLDLIVIILIPAMLVLLIISIIVCGIFIHRRSKNKSKNEDLREEDPHFGEFSTEKVPMPMFEEDVPSVLEVEMEELDQWIKKDGETAEDTKHM